MTEASISKGCEYCVDPETRQIHEAVCLMRRESGVCPQLSVIHKLMNKIEWLLDSAELDLTVDEIPEKGGCSLDD